MHLRRAVNTLRHTQRLTNAGNAYRQSKTSVSAPASFNEEDLPYNKQRDHHVTLSSPVMFNVNETSPLVSRSVKSSRYKNNEKNIIEIMKCVIFSSTVNIFLLLIPLAIIMMFSKWNGTLVFIVNFLVLLPLANILGEATESLARHTGETIGGLINATFGNAVEVVIAIFALSKGQISVVQSSLIGSVLSNLLLVLGCCFLAAGIKKKESEFNATGASANTSLLMLSTFAMLLPTYAVYSHSGTTVKDHQDLILSLSRIAGVVLLLMYFQLLIFQLKTHLFLFTSEDEDEEEPDLTFTASLVTLLIATLLVSFFSNNLVSSIDAFTETLHISKAFVGVILLPVIGNAVEHITAVKVALHDKMELAMGVAVGSATQISLFVVPVTVIAGWILGQPMTLAFPIFESIVYLMSVLIVVGIVSDGKSNWLEGSLLLTTYFMVACALYWINVDG